MMTDNSSQSLPMINSLQHATILMPSHKTTDIVLGTSLAPELYNSSGYDYKVDTWNYGAILYYMLAGASHCP